MNEQKEKFTPGPWKSVYRTYERYGEQVWEQLVLDNEDNPICQMTCYEDDQEKYSNLIAAAPQMYRLLSLLEDVCRDKDLTIWMNAIGKVLKNARGEE